MRPRLRADVRYAKSPAGVYVQGFAGACTLTGEHSYAWLDRLAPFLTGEHALDDLVGPLPAEQRVVVEHLVGALFEQRLLVDAGQDAPHSLGDAEQRCYEAEIAYIRYAADSAEHRFERLRAARVAVCGAGPVVAALLEAGLRSGWRRVLARVPAAEVDLVRAAVSGAVRDDAQDVAVEPATGSGVVAADLVLWVSDRVGDLVAAARDHARSGAALGQVLVGDAEAWATAVGPPERVAAESCWRRLSARRGTEEDLLTGPVPAVVASHVALSCFTYLTGLADAPEQPVLTRVDLRDLTSGAHRPPRYERVRAADVRPDEVVAADGFGARLARLVDERVGVLGRLSEDDLPQVPLAVCRASVSDPEGVLPAWVPEPVVTGWGVDREQARLHAALAALAAYGSLVDPGGARTDLLTGARCAVPAPDRRVPYRAPVGVAAGRSWVDAVTAGLRAHCEALLAEHADAARGGVDAAEVVREFGDEEAVRLLGLLRAVDRRVEVVDLGGVLGVPAFAFRLPGGAPVVTCAADAGEALRDGLGRALLGWQCDPPPAVGPTRGTAEPRLGAPARDPRCRALADALRRAGHAPVAVALAVDEEVRDLVPCLVRVVIDRD